MTIGLPPSEGWMSARVASWLEERRADYANVRAAVEWAAGPHPCLAMRLLVDVKELFFMVGQADGKRLAELVLQRCPEQSRYRAEATIAAGFYAFLLSDVPTAISVMTQAAHT